MIIINGMLYYSILTDHLYVIVVRFMILKLYIIYRYTKRLCGLLGHSTSDQRIFGHFCDDPLRFVLNLARL